MIRLPTSHLEQMTVEDMAWHGHREEVCPTNSRPEQEFRQRKEKEQCQK
jgi:hypothetical protein